jgi:hypothetical protein
MVKLVMMRPLYAEAVRRMILDALDGNGVDQLAHLSLSILTRLDPDRPTLACCRHELAGTVTTEMAVPPVLAYGHFRSGGDGRCVTTQAASTDIVGT